MNFQELGKVEDVEFFLDLAFRNAKKAGHTVFLKSSGEPLARARRAEAEKILIFSKTLEERFFKITKAYPSIDNMPEFYQELLRKTLDVDRLKKALASLTWVMQKSKEFSRVYHKKITKAHSQEFITKTMSEYYGRMSSLVKQIRDNLQYLEYSRKAMKEYPTLKTDLYTIAITGFPNIGKSTLLSKLTPAKPRIENYAFTTKGLNQGYAKYGLRKIQFVDTPGVLDRDKKNNIEEQAYLILKYLTNLIIYIIDLTEPYPLAKQEKLLKGLKDYDKPIIVYLSKTDILDKALVEKAKRKYKAVITVDALNKKIEKSIKEYY